MSLLCGEVPARVSKEIPIIPCPIVFRANCDIEFSMTGSVQQKFPRADQGQSRFGCRLVERTQRATIQKIGITMYIRCTEDNIESSPLFFHAPCLPTAGKGDKPKPP